MKLKIKDANIVQLTKYPGEDGCTQVLVLRGLLTPSIADKLGIKDGCYHQSQVAGEKEAWVPYHYDSYPSPALRINGADVYLGDREARATLIHKFKVKQPKTGGDSDISLELSFRVHFGGKEPLFAMVDRINKDTFIFEISAQQCDLVFGDEPNEEEAENEAAEPDTGCVSCNNGIPLGLGGMHENGQKCTAAAKTGSPALASVREVAGGTHQKRKGQIDSPVN